MTYITRNLCLAALGAMLLLSPWRTTAQGLPISQQALATKSGQPNAQAFSQTGLLPIFALDLQIDPSWVDGATAPSQSAQFGHNGVSDTLQQIWETLRPDGFNMIRFPLNIEDPRSIVRLANLCNWAKANNVTLIPVLRGTATAQKDATSLSSTVNSFVSGVVSLMRQPDPSLAA